MCGKVIAMVGALVFGVIGVASVRAQPAAASEEVLLRVTQQELEEDAAGKAPQAHAESLAKQFKVSPRAVQDLRAAKQVWGGNRPSGSAWHRNSPRRTPRAFPP
jgi:hypothetical protein